MDGHGSTKVAISNITTPSSSSAAGERAGDSYLDCPSHSFCCSQNTGIAGLGASKGGKTADA